MEIMLRGEAAVSSADRIIKRLKTKIVLPKICAGGEAVNSERRESISQPAQPRRKISVEHGTASMLKRLAGSVKRPNILATG